MESNEPFKNADELRKCGNESYKQKKYIEAIDFYNQALELIDSVDSISKILLNCATVSMKISTSKESACLAIVYAGAALAISPCYEKASGRLFHELDRIREDEMGRHKIQGIKLHTDTDILLSISDALELCFDEILVRFDEISQQKTKILTEAENIPIELKATGNALATAGKFSEALLSYQSAIQTVSYSMSVGSLLSNRAISYLQLNRPVEALQSAVCSICCDPKFLKSHFHRATALSSLGQIQKARDAVKCGLQLEPKYWPLLNLNDHLAKAGETFKNETSEKRTPDTFIRNRIGKIPSLRIEREIHVSPTGKMSAREEQSMNKSFEAIMKMNSSMKLIDLDVPPFNVEFSSAGLWPALCDIPRLEDRLSTAYENGRSAAFFYNDYALNKSFEPKHLIRRMNPGYDFEGITTWFAQAKMGEINLHLKNRFKYDPRVLHSFANSPNTCEQISVGKTIVSVGFVDLGFLREAQLSTSSVSNMPTRWVGFEASAYCVAKTAVIISMLRLNAPIDCILQVWYSSAWGSKTLIMFRQAVRFVLDGRSNLTGVLHFDVRVLLELWQHSKVCLADARSAWLKATPDEIKWRDIGNFKRISDRIALCSYSISGQLLEATMGSVVMFVLPPGYLGGLALNERVFECISLQQLTDRCLGGAPDIMAATVSHLREGIEKLLDWVQNGRVIIDVRLCAVDPEDPVSIAELAALDPHTISWSNICDYCPPKSFHDMARACSGRNTVHHAYRWDIFYSFFSFD